ncbi:MAG TPA: hypothetical protein VJS88_03050, partial [Chthoniobacterales bacterium]|nr:hypothetical protein [Chthoniobacterales bacterium]
MTNLRPFAGVLSTALIRISILTLLVALPLARIPAATPPDGHLAATDGAKVEWDGIAATLPGGGPAGEATCIDGVNCDVFTIHVDGTTEDWRGKSIVVKITFPLGDDADLYLHKDTVDGPPAGSGQNGGPADGDGVSETATINPATSGTGDYVVHVLYATFIPGDKVHGVATVM